MTKENLETLLTALQNPSFVDHLAASDAETRDNALAVFADALRSQRAICEARAQRIKEQTSEARGAIAYITAEETTDETNLAEAVVTAVRDAVTRTFDRIEEQRQAALRRVFAGEPVEVPEMPRIPGVHHREVYRLVVEDSTAIPRGYLVPDEKRVLEALAAGISVPGCRRRVGYQLTFREVPGGR